MNKFALSPKEFKNSIKENYYSMNLEEIFKINIDKINKNWEQWEKFQFKKVYAKYLAMLMGLPEHIQFLDNNLLLFKISRDIAHELIIRLAEAYYYDDNMSVVGETLDQTYYPEYKRNVSDIQLAYFFELVNQIYNRVEIGDDTLSIIRKTLQDDTYLSDIFAREKGVTNGYLRL